MHFTSTWYIAKKIGKRFELLKNSKELKTRVCAMSRKNDAWYLAWHVSQKVGFYWESWELRLCLCSPSKYAGRLDRAHLGSWLKVHKNVLGKGDRYLVWWKFSVGDKEGTGHLFHIAVNSWVMKRDISRFRIEIVLECIAIIKFRA